MEMMRLKNASDTIEECLYKHCMPLVSVGVMKADKVCFVLKGNYRCLQNDKIYSGLQTVIVVDGLLKLNDDSFELLSFAPQDDHCSFELKAVTIGIGFHWQRIENQSFQGILHCLLDGQIQVVNQLGVEQYLQAVIASEMKSTSSIELLKAHAVISRSWLLAPMANGESTQAVCQHVTDNEVIRWYERDAHQIFDVCADDHCQRYQGIARIADPAVSEAIEATLGEVLMYEGKICDARFSKSCGGATEIFSSCWDNHNEPYLVALRDMTNLSGHDSRQKEQIELCGGEMLGNKRNLTNEQEAEQWIMSAPAAFCNVNDEQVLKQVLNNYDTELPNLYRWQVTYTTDELSQIIKEKSGYDFGTVVDLVPLQRGASGRIVRLRIEGTARTMIVGKELEIRKWLSPTHLFSSAFVVRRTFDGFELHGAGWGHGVGLCQIGAAMMAHQGYSYHQILAHYFPHAELKKVYCEKIK